VYWDSAADQLTVNENELEMILLTVDELLGDMQQGTLDIL
jgi:hypothetical protein